MANTYKNIVITPNIGSAIDDPKIVFSGGNATVNTDITLRTYPTSNGTLSFEGSAGQLFSVTNQLTGTLFSVNDISGIPSIEVLDTGLVKLAQYNGNVGIGTANASYKLDVNGTTRISGNLIFSNTTSNGITFADGTRQTSAFVGVSIDQVARDTANTADVRSSAAYFHANGAFIKANAAFDAANVVAGGLTSANARITIIEGTNATQNTNISNKVNLTGSLNQTVSGNVTIGQDLIVSGNLIITGNINSQNVQQLTVADPLIVLGVGNYVSDTKDIGFASHYNDGTNAHAGIIRDSTTKEFYVFQGYTPEVDATNNVDINNASFTKANLNAGIFRGNLIATTAVVNGIDLSAVNTTQNTAISATDGKMQSAYFHANGAFIKANAAFDAANASFAGVNTAITIIQGVNASQNVRIDYSNTAITIIQGVDNSQNVRLDWSNTAISATNGKMESAYFHANGAFIRANAAFDYANVVAGGLTTANASIITIQGTNSSQNANIISLQTLANTDYTTLSATPGTYGSSSLVPVFTLAANGRVTSVTNTTVTTPIPSGFLANSVIFANTAGYLSSTANIQFFASNNTLYVANAISVGTLEAEPNSMYVAGRVGFANNNISVVYQVYNANTNSLDTIFG